MNIAFFRLFLVIFFTRHPYIFPELSVRKDSAADPQFCGILFVLSDKYGSCLQTDVFDHFLAPRAVYSGTLMNGGR